MITFILYRTFTKFSRPSKLKISEASQHDEQSKQHTPTSIHASDKVHANGIINVSRTNIKTVFGIEIVLFNVIYI